MGFEKKFFNLINNEVFGTPLPQDFSLTEKEIDFIYRLSKKHELAHLTGDALLRNKLLSGEKMTNLFKDQVMFAVYIYEQQNARLKTITSVLEREKIANIPLKGAEIRKLYADPWMRNSCDIDVLVHEEDAERATKALVDSGFDSNGKMDFHDIHLFYGDVHLELHFNILENVKQLDGLLSEVWEYSEKITEFTYRETPEYFVFHHIAHMAYHFLSGGCGIRPFLDVKILRDNNYYDENKLLLLLEKSGLTKFYEEVKSLADVWFNGGEYSEIGKMMETYILIGGVYGSKENGIAAGVASNGQNKKKYILKLAFPSYRSMCSQYPILRKHKWLLPFCYIARLFRKTVGKDRKHVKNRIEKTMSYSNDKVETINALLKTLNIKK